jgi:hypothetical protein
MLGFANASGNFYRHYLIDTNATLNLTVKVIMGNPVVVMKMSKTPAYP